MIQKIVIIKEKKTMEKTNVIKRKGMGIFTLCLLCFALSAGIRMHGSRAEAASISNAQNYTLGKTISGTLTDTAKTWRFTLPSSGRIILDVTTKVTITDYYIYNSSGDKVWEQTWQRVNNTTGQMHLEEKIDLTAGNYYMQMDKTYGGIDDNFFTFTMTFASAGESFAETGYGTNNTIATASVIGFSQNYKGQIAENDEKDMYRFTLNKSGRVSIGLTAYIYNTDYYIYDMDGEEIWSTTWETWNSTSKQMRLDTYVDLTSGSYIFVIKKRDGTGNYNFTMKYTSANESFSEKNWGSNNDISRANVVQLGKRYQGQIAKNDQKDFYKFSTKGSINLIVNAAIYRSDYYIYDAKGNEVWEKTWQYWNDTTHMLALKEKITLTSGTYYLVVGRNDNNTGNYNFQINSYYDLQSLTLNKTNLVLKPGQSFTLKAGFAPTNATNKKIEWRSGNSYVATVSAKGVVKAKTYGDTAITVTSQENDEISRSCRVIVTPKKAKIMKVISYKLFRSKKRGITVYYSVPGGSDGIQIVYAKSKSMKSSKKIKKYLKLKKGNYYFRARAYTLVNGKRYYGSWSKVKKKKVK